MPRNVDVRVMWARHDRLDDPPLTWEALLRADAVFGFTGRESGLFGTFFEHVASHGGELFDSDRQPTLETTHAVEAVDALCRIARRGPTALPSWHYDDVDAALGAGIVDMAATWPGGFAALRESPAAPHLSPHPYLSGPAGLRSYSGCHGWAMPRTCGDVPAALDAIRRLSSFEAHALDAQSGTVCAHVDAFASVTPLDAVDAARLDIIRATIADGMITYPPLPRFPEIEDAGWSSINAALRGELSPSRGRRPHATLRRGDAGSRLASAPVPSWTPHKLANPLTGQIELKVGAKCEAIVDLPNVPTGTKGKVMLVNGFNRLRYWVHFENGVDIGQLDGAQIAPLKKKSAPKSS